MLPDKAPYIMEELCSVNPADDCHTVTVTQIVLPHKLV